MDTFPCDGVIGGLGCSFSSLLKQTVLFLCPKIFFFPFTEEKVIFFSCGFECPQMVPLTLDGAQSADGQAYLQGSRLQTLSCFYLEEPELP